MAMKGYSTFPKAWSLTIRCCFVSYSEHSLWGKVLPLLQMCSLPSQLGLKNRQSQSRGQPDLSRDHKTHQTIGNVTQFPGKKRIKISSKISNKYPRRYLNNRKCFLGTNRRSLKYAPKEFSKVNACARDPPWCYKNTIFSRHHRSVTHTNPEWYVLIVFSAAPCSFKLQTTVSFQVG